MTHFEKAVLKQMGIPKKERDKAMDFYDTVGGRRFVDVTVPTLTNAIKDLTEAIKTLTDRVEQLEKDRERNEEEREL